MTIVPFSEGECSGFAKLHCLGPQIIHLPPNSRIHCVSDSGSGGISSVGISRYLSSPFISGFSFFFFSYCGRKVSCKSISSKHSRPQHDGLCVPQLRQGSNLSKKSTPTFLIRRSTITGAKSMQAAQRCPSSKPRLRSTSR